MQVRFLPFLPLLLLASAHADPLARTIGTWRTTEQSRKSSHRRRSSLSIDSKEHGSLLSLPDRSASTLSDIKRVEPCSNQIVNNLFRGAFLRIASDISGGTVLESIKTRVTVTTEGPVEATRNIIREGGVLSLWKGTPSRTIEGALIGGLFLVGSALTKAQLRKLGVPPTMAALSAGVVGGVAQSLAMTPAGMIFTAIHSNHDNPRSESESAITVTRRIVREKGILGMYAGNGPMMIRQATNWASRAGFTEIARTTLGLSKYGLMGELSSGVIGGVGSCWNTPIETIRVIMQRDITRGLPPKTMRGYWNDIVERDGYPGLFRGVTPRAIQAVWQTSFLVVVPNLLGI